VLARLPLGPGPSLPHLRRRSPGLVRRIHRYYDRPRLLASVHRRLRLLVFPTRTGMAAATRPDARSPRLRRDPFVCEGVFDLGRATAPRMTAPHMLPSATLKASAPTTLLLTRLNSPPYTIAVYASPWSSPSKTQHSLPRRALPLTWTGLPPAGSRKLPGALVSQFERGQLPGAAHSGRVGAVRGRRALHGKIRVGHSRSPSRRLMKRGPIVTVPARHLGNCPLCCYFLF
jgi:hypothetical protein